MTNITDNTGRQESVREGRREGGQECVREGRREGRNV
jgi:hypothetical protein